MSNEIQQINSTLTPEDIATLAAAGVIPANTPPAVVTVFATNCRLHGLSPFKKEIYLVKYGSIYATIVGIDGFRNKATRTGQYAGIDDAKFNLQSNGQYETAAQLRAANKLPISCTVTAYRIVSGVRCPFSHTAVFSEFAGSGKWQTMPFQMIQKVAEAFCLKKGFADELGGLHIEEEKEAFTGETIEVQQPVIEKQTLESSHPKWGVVVEWLAGERTTISEIEKRYNMTDSNKTKLLNEVKSFATTVTAND